MANKYIGINPDADLSNNITFFDAAESGDLQKVKKMLEENKYSAEYLNKKSPITGKTALILAAENGEKDVVKFLCEIGANTTIKDAGTWTAKKHADYHGQNNIVSMIEKQREDKK
jgi:ankyrin repeat protein